MASAFCAWREYRFDSVHGRKALLWWQHSSLKGMSDSGCRHTSRDGCTGAFTKWVEYTTERQNEADQTANSLAHWMNQSMSRAFEKWMVYVGQRQRRMILIQNAIAHWEQNTFAKVMLNRANTMCHRVGFSGPSDVDRVCHCCTREERDGMALRTANVQSQNDNGFYLLEGGCGEQDIPEADSMGMLHAVQQ